jgi:hypothetical protein
MPRSHAQMRADEARGHAAFATAGQLAMRVAAGLTLRIRGCGLPPLTARMARTRALFMGVASGVARSSSLPAQAGRCRRSA